VKTLVISINMDSLGAMQFGNYFTPEDIKGGLDTLRKHGNSIPEIINGNILVEVKARIKGFEKLQDFLIIDRKRFALKIKEMLESHVGLYTRQGLAVNIIEQEDGYIIRTSDSIEFKAKVAIICTGTFLDARICWGDNTIRAGRPGEIFSSRLYKNMIKNGFKFKTEKHLSAAKILKNTIDRKSENIQVYDIGKHEIYSASISRDIGSGKKEKRIYFIPEGMETEEMYSYGYETDAAGEDQQNSLMNIKGMERIYMTRPGYRIEYGCLEADETGLGQQANASKRLFFAGRITGIKTYGESLVQGLLSGKNAARVLRGKSLIDLKDL
jgi:tRNA uridine 5-carboxymethylaminomethyl modification enzyme